MLQVHIEWQTLSGVWIALSRGCFKGDRLTVCTRSEELLLVDRPGDNRIRVAPVSALERPQFVRVDFGNHLVADIPRRTWAELRETTPVWLEIPPSAIRQL